MIPLYTGCIVIHLLLKIWTEFHTETVLGGIYIDIFFPLYLIYAIPLIQCLFHEKQKKTMIL
jgi:hypothetical protein